MNHFSVLVMLFSASLSLQGCKADPPEEASEEKPLTAEPVSVQASADPVKPDMVRIPGGTFMMGDIFNEGDEKEKPARNVTLSDYQLAKRELTVAEFAAFVTATGYKTTAEVDGFSNVFTNGGFGEMPGVNWRCDAQGVLRTADTWNHPVLHVSWTDAVQYCNWLSVQLGLQPVYGLDTIETEATPEMKRQLGDRVKLDDANKQINPNLKAFQQVYVMNPKANGYRLPTEAEWEYAARSGGKNYRFAWGSGPQPKGNVADAAAVRQGAAKSAAFPDYDDGFAFTAPVGEFSQGELGLFDMTGNVWEWCWDWYSPYSAMAEANFAGPQLGTYRIIRGGGWRGAAANLRNTGRNANVPEARGAMLGFRLAQNIGKR
jgi:sulfatase modifying factor 1